MNIKQIDLDTLHWYYSHSTYNPTLHGHYSTDNMEKSNKRLARLGLLK